MRSLAKSKTLTFFLFAYRKIREFWRKAGENLADTHRPNGCLWNRISDQVARNSLEWAHWERFLNMSGYSILKNDHSEQASLTCAGGSLKVINEFGEFPADSESINTLKPLLLKNFENQGSDLCLRRGMISKRI